MNKQFKDWDKTWSFYCCYLVKTMFFKKKINPSLQLLLAYAEKHSITIHRLATDGWTAHYPTKVIFAGTCVPLELKSCWCEVSALAHELGHVVGETNDEEKAWDVARLLLTQIIGEIPIGFEALRKECLHSYK